MQEQPQQSDDVKDQLRDATNAYCHALIEEKIRNHDSQVKRLELILIAFAIVVPALLLAVTIQSTSEAKLEAKLAAGEAAGEVAGEVAGDMARDMAREVAGEVARDMARFVAESAAANVETVYQLALENHIRECQSR